MPIKSLLSKEVKSMLQEAGGLEMQVHLLYQQIANSLQRAGLFSLQKYFLHESKEELGHYNKLVDFTNDMGDMLDVPTVTIKPVEVDSIMEALEIAYAKELELMKKYVEFYEMAEEAGDCVTATFLIEFMQIQRKSVGEYGDLIAKLEQNKSDVFAFEQYIETLLK